MIDISNKNVGILAQKYNFFEDTTEKTMVAMDLLERIFSSEWKNVLALKGGTALNLFYEKLSRLSIDIDLDFLVTTKEDMLTKRKQFKKFLVDMMAANGYLLSEKSTFKYSLDTYKFRYSTTAGGKDVIRIEVNYMDRAHVLPPRLMELNVLDYKSDVKINVCDTYDIYGAKLAALINRTKPRDVFDICTFIDHIPNDFDLSLLRKCFVLYTCIDNKKNLLDFNINQVEGKDWENYSHFLLPFLHKKVRFDYGKAYEKISAFFNDYMQLDDDERRFVSEFNKGHYDPKTLFGYNDFSVRIGWFPAAFRTSVNSDSSQQEKAMATFTRMQGRGEDSLKGLLCLDLLEKVKKQYGEDDTFKDLYYGEDVFPAERDNERGLMYRISICSDRDDATLSFFKSSGRYDAKKPDEYYVDILNECKSIRSSGKPFPQTDNNSNNPDKGGPAK